MTSPTITTSTERESRALNVRRLSESTSTAVQTWHKVPSRALHPRRMLPTVVNTHALRKDAGKSGERWRCLPDTPPVWEASPRPATDRALDSPPGTRGCGQGATCPRTLPTGVDLCATEGVKEASAASRPR